MKNVLFFLVFLTTSINMNAQLIRKNGKIEAVAGIDSRTTELTFEHSVNFGEFIATIYPLNEFGNPFKETDFRVQVYDHIVDTLTLNHDEKGLSRSVDFFLRRGCLYTLLFQRARYYNQLVFFSTGVPYYEKERKRFLKDNPIFSVNLNDSLVRGLLSQDTVYSTPVLCLSAVNTRYEMADAYRQNDTAGRIAGRPMGGFGGVVNAGVYMKPLKIGDEMSLDSIYYDYNKWNLRERSKQILDEFAKILIANPGVTIELGSHTDSRGRDAYNQWLSEKRAESAVSYLVSKGIPATQITSKGYGESRLVIPDAKNEAEHQKNRRTAFKVTDVDEKVQEQVGIRDLIIKLGGIIENPYFPPGRGLAFFGSRCESNPK